MVADYLKIGARGWRHQQWLGTYYPDDLPEDWRLTYYANDFQTVLVPKEYWDIKKGYELDEWHEAVGGEFQFYIECPNLEGKGERQLFENQCSQLGDLLGGLVVPDKFDITKLKLSCPIVEPTTYLSNELCLGFLDKDLDDLRAVRKWLDMFCEQCGTKQKSVFITDKANKSVAADVIVKIKALSEMMRL